MFQEEDKLIIYYIIWVAVFLVLLALIVISLLLYNQKRKLKYRNNLLKINNTHESEMLKSQIQTQENTFQNISREIHDNIGQKLTLAKLHLNGWIQSNLPNSNALSSVVDMISESLQDLRDISRSLSSEVILQNGLIKALENELELVGKTSSCRFRLHILGEQSYIHSEKELIIFRIIQEALTNVLKHAHASLVNIEFIYEANQLSIVITDNGVGFDQSASINKNGLNNMQSRVRLLEGSFDVHSIRHQGTRLHMAIPLLSSPKTQPHA